MPLGAHKVTLLGVAGVADSGSAVLLSTATASNDASISFTLPTAYKQVKFGFYNVTPATDTAGFTFQVNATDDPGGGYDTSLITSTVFSSYHFENDGNADLGYFAADDQAQGNSFQILARELGYGADESCAGELHIYNPASTVYVKHFMATVNFLQYEDRCYTHHVAGYINDTTAIDDIQFKMSSGAITSGKIKMWGVR